MEQLIREANRLSEHGLHNEAEAMLRNALILNTDNRNLNKALLLLLIEVGNYEEAQKITEKLKNLDLPSPPPIVEENPAPIDRIAVKPGQTSQTQDELDLDFKYAESIEQKELQLSREADPGEISGLNLTPDQAAPVNDPPVERPIDVSTLAESVADYYDEAGEEADEQVNEEADLFTKEASRPKELDRANLEEEADSSLDEEYALEISEELNGREELSTITSRETREGRALQVASEICFEFDLDSDFCDLLSSIFLHYGWSATQRKLRDLLEQEVELKELALAFEIRQLWASNIEFHERISYDGRDQRYITLPWRLAVEFVRIYHSYPQIEEIEGYLEDIYVEWDRRSSLHRKFNSFYAMVKDIIENCDGPEPPAITEYMR